jgi:hypothetical protein
MFLELWNRLESRLHRRNLEREMDAEMRFHLEMQIERNRAVGMSPEEARRRALRDFGGVEQIKEECRDRRHTWIDSLWQDVRYALRGLRRDPTFTVTVVLTLALAIGATTSTFTIVDSTLFRPLPYRHPDRLVMLMGRSSDSGRVYETLGKEQGAAVMGQLREFLKRLQDAGRRLAVDDHDQLRAGMVIQCLLDVVGIDRFAPFTLDTDDVGSGALGDFGHPLAEQAADTHNHRLARLDCVDQGSFHPAVTGRRYCGRELVLRQEGLAQHTHDFIHDARKVRVEVTQQRLRHGVQDTRVDIDRTGPHQRARRNDEIL